jgi:Family of unknown function (DUF6064)
MSEWWTYRPGDFLLFSPRVYWRMFELHNAQFWPLHLLMLASGLTILLLISRGRASSLWTVAILATLWIFVGWFFLWNRYAAINWAIAHVAPVFALEALLLAIAATRRGLVFDRQDIASRCGGLIATLALIVYPVLPWVFGHPSGAAETFGIAPDPTALATLGLLLMASGRFSLLLVPIPLLWLLLSGLTLRTMGDHQGWIPLVAVGTTVLLLVVRLARAPPGTPARSGHHRR